MHLSVDKGCTRSTLSNQFDVTLLCCATTMPVEELLDGPTGHRPRALGVRGPLGQSLINHIERQKDYKETQNDYRQMQSSHKATQVTTKRDAK